MSDHLRRKAWLAGRDTALAEKPRTACKRRPGTIFYDDWHDGYNEGERQRERAE